MYPTMSVICVYQRNLTLAFAIYAVKPVKCSAKCLAVNANREEDQEAEKWKIIYKHVFEKYIKMSKHTVIKPRYQNWSNKNVNILQV